MKALLINGSPNKDGCTKTALLEVSKTLNEEGIQTEIVDIGSKDIRGCIACKKCREIGKCVFDDLANELVLKLKECDGLVVGSPVYFSNANGSLLNLLTRMFYSCNYDLSFKVGASVVSARRAGCSSTFDQLNKFFTIRNMPVVSSQYWNNVHGYNKEDTLKDLEGLQTMRVLGRNMAFLIKSIALGKEKYFPLKQEKKISTSFMDGK